MLPPAPDLNLSASARHRRRKLRRLKQLLMRVLATYMMEDQCSISAILDVIWVLRSLERVGDHARNICQHLVYLVKGVNVSHSTLQQMKVAVEKG